MGQVPISTAGLAPTAARATALDRPADWRARRPRATRHTQSGGGTMYSICKFLTMALLAIGIAAAGRPASATGLAGDALRFDGGADEVGDFVDVPGDSMVVDPSLSVSPYTVEAFVYLFDGNFDEMHVLSKGVDRGNYTLSVFGNLSPVGLQGDAGLSHACAIPAACGNQGDRRVSSGDAAPRIAFGGWTHIAGTFDGSAMRIFVNGLLANTFNVSDEPVQSSSDLFIGRADFGGEFPTPEFFEGRVDEVRIWSVARTPEQIFGK